MSPNYNIASTFVLNPTLFPTVDTTYHLMILDSIGNTTSHSIKFVINSPIVPSIGNDTLICLNSTYNINVSGSFVSYLWQDGTNSNQYTINSSVEDTFLLVLNTVDQNGCMATDSSTIFVTTCAKVNDILDSSTPIVYPNVLYQRKTIFITGNLPANSRIDFSNSQGWHEMKLLENCSGSFSLNAPPGLVIYRILSNSEVISKGKIIVLE